MTSYSQYSNYQIKSVGNVDGKTTLAAVFLKNNTDYRYIEALSGETRRIEVREAAFQEKDLAARIARLEEQGIEVTQLERDALSDLRSQNAQLAKSSVPSLDQ